MPEQWKAGDRFQVEGVVEWVGDNGAFVSLGTPSPPIRSYFPEADLRRIPDSSSPGVAHVDLRPGDHCKLRDGEGCWKEVVVAAPPQVPVRYHGSPPDCPSSVVPVSDLTLISRGDPDLSHLHESPAGAPADSETRVVGLVIDAVKSGRRVRIDVEIDKAE